MAGSERIEKSGSTGGLAKEAAHINRSLTFLEQVVVALTQAKRDHVPYRQSKLTYLLKDSLGGNCNTYLIACVRASSQHGSETLSTLRFASRMKCIENIPVRNNLVSKESSGSTRHLLNQIESLKKELAMRDLLMGKSEAWLSELNRRQSDQACSAVLKYLSSQSDTDPGTDSPPDIHSLAESRYILRVAKDVLWEACSNSESTVSEAVNRVKRKLLNSSAFSVDVQADCDAEGVVIDDPIDGTLSVAKGAGTVETSGKNEEFPNKLPVEITFDEFKMTAGKELQELYNNAKANLKSSKDQQRQLVNTINSKKHKIDELNEVLLKYREGKKSPNCSDGDVPSTESAQLYEKSLRDIEDAKKAYRETHAQLVACKSEIEEHSRSKKKYLGDIMSSYEAYRASPDP